MELPTVDLYGAPSYGAIGLPPAGMVFHTPEWGPDPSLSSAIDCARWQGTAGNTSGGSYHGLLGHDSSQFPHNMALCEDPMHWTMVRSVPWNRAAGGLSGNHNPPNWNPDRFPFIRQILPAAAFNDPNKWLHQISFGGAAAWYVANGFPKGLRIAAAWWVLTLERIYGYDSLLTLHRYWQADRSDPGPVGSEQGILDEYFKLVNGDEPVPEPTPQPAPTRFSDVPATHWAFDAVEWAVANGITTGKADGTFGPDEFATRAQVMVFLQRMGKG